MLDDSRLQRWYMHLCILGRCPSLAFELAPLALSRHYRDGGFNASMCCGATSAAKWLPD